MHERFSLTVYAIEATVHAPTWEGVYSEIKKVLKPGGIVCLRFGSARVLTTVIFYSLVSTNGV
jgi:hypothetical protein